MDPYPAEGKKLVGLESSTIPVNLNHVVTLHRLGFEYTAAEAALVACNGNLDEAVDALCQQSRSYPQQQSLTLQKRRESADSQYKSDKTSSGEAECCICCCGTKWYDGHKCEGCHFFTCKKCWDNHILESLTANASDSVSFPLNVDCPSCRSSTAVPISEMMCPMPNCMCSLFTPQMLNLAKSDADTRGEINSYWLQTYVYECNNENCRKVCLARYCYRHRVCPALGCNSKLVSLSDNTRKARNSRAEEEQEEVVALFGNGENQQTLYGPPATTQENRTGSMVSDTSNEFTNLTPAKQIALQNMGFDHSAAEAALIACNDNQAEAAKLLSRKTSEESYLRQQSSLAAQKEVENLNKLIQMGFDIISADAALVACNNNLEKALEALNSQSLICQRFQDI
mmetsp:Transcript_31499/g.40494  ORF Transcript_31499/g.40494 Transcript_31499/m.40494 type:complete len:398 (+) Transcript_31499:175-1368(+)